MWEQQRNGYSYESDHVQFQAGCVADALTFYIIRRLGLEDAIVGICGRIGMTESSVDVFRQRSEEIELHGGRPFLVMSFHNGQYFREEITTEKQLTALNEVKNDLLWIENNCDILPAESERAYRSHLAIFQKGLVEIFSIVF